MRDPDLVAMAREATRRLGACRTGWATPRVTSISGELEAPEFHARFLTSPVFFLTGEQPGLVAFGDLPASVVPVFSALSELARFVLTHPELAGQETRWASTIGAEILELVPPGYDITLDPSSADPVTIPRGARRAETVLIARRAQP